jgi:sialate O-acetylesterase
VPRIVFALPIAALALGTGLGARAGQTPAPLTLGPLFQDHAVLQRDRPIAVWGTTSAGETVAVALDGATATARADAAGRWTATLPARGAGGPFTLEVRAGAATRALADVLVGDVFLCGGQSNMEFAVGQSRGGPFAAARSANDRMRLFTVGHAGSPAPLTRLEPAPAWQVAAPESVRPFSAACYYFGAEIARTQRVPVGLIHSSWGGTAIEPWIGPSGARTLGLADDLRTLDLFGRDPQAANLAFGRSWEAWWARHGTGQPWTVADQAPWTDVPALTNWKTWGVPELADHDGMVWYRRTATVTAAQAAQRATLSLGGIDEVDETWLNGRVVANTFGWGTRRTYDVAPGILRAGENVLVLNVLSTYDAGGLLGPAEAMALTFADGSKVPLGDAWRYRYVPRSVGRPPRAPWETHHGLTTLYNAMIAPLGPVALRAAAWYQGESNTDQASDYPGRLAALMASWRSQFGADLPFLVVQLPNFGAVPTRPVESDWAELRDAQRRAVAADAHAALVVTIDLGEPDNLHPTNKRDVGLRLARAARHVVYGEAISPAGPAVRSARRDPGGVVVTFGDVEQGLVTYSADRAIGFELCGDGPGSCRFVAGEVSGDQVRLPAAGWQGAPPARVRFCWAAAPVCNLSDASGLPAGPFELRLD